MVPAGTRSPAGIGLAKGSWPFKFLAFLVVCALRGVVPNKILLLD